MRRIIEYFRRQYDPTPDWAKTIIRNQEKIMAAIDDLVTAVSAEEHYNLDKAYPKGWGGPLGAML